MSSKTLIGIVAVMIVILIGFLVFTAEEPTPITDKDHNAQEIAQDWIIENASTFTERGGMELEHIDTTEVGEEVYEVTFEFESSFAGHGPVYDDEMTAQVITPHTIVVTIDEGNVVSAITDDYYDEMNNKETAEDTTDDDYLVADIYFYVVADNIEELVSEERIIDYNNPEESAINELLQGSLEGYSTAIDNEATLNSFFIEDGIAYVDFSSELDASGSATVIMIREQIENTLFQFSGISEVVISIEGETEEILQP